MIRRSGRLTQSRCTHLIAQLRCIDAHFALIDGFAARLTLSSCCCIAHEAHVEGDLVASGDEVIVRRSMLGVDVLAVVDGQVLSRQLQRELLVAELLTRRSDARHFLLRQLVEVSLDLTRREYTRRRPCEAKLLRLNLRGLRVHLEAETLLDVLKLLVVDFVILARTFAGLAGLSVD